MILKEVIGGAASVWVADGLRQGSKLVRIKGVKKYLEILQTLRTAWLNVLLTQLFLLLFAISLLCCLGSFLYLLPLTPEVKVMIFFALSLSISSASLAGFLYFNSEKKWLHFSKADVLLEKLIASLPPDS